MDFIFSDRCSSLKGFNVHFIHPSCPLVDISLFAHWHRNSSELKRAILLFNSTGLQIPFSVCQEFNIASLNSESA